MKLEDISKLKTVQDLVNFVLQYSSRIPFDQWDLYRAEVLKRAEKLGVSFDSFVLLLEEKEK